MEYFKKSYTKTEVYNEPTNVFHVAIAEMPAGVTEAQIITDIEGLLADVKPALTESEIRMVNILFVQVLQPTPFLPLAPSSSTNTSLARLPPLILCSGLSQPPLLHVPLRLRLQGGPAAP